jgi:hypothetical protein
MEADEKRVETILTNFFRTKQEKTGPVDCPAEEELASYLSGGLIEERKNIVESHLAECTICMDTLIVSYRAQEDANVAAVPQWLMAKAQRLFQPVPTTRVIFDLALRLTKGALELVKTSGQFVPMAVPASVRGQEKSTNAHVIQVVKEIAGLRIGVAAENAEPGTCEVVVRVEEPNGKPADGIRVSLDSDGREQASYVTREGRAVFDRLPQGEYNLRISSLEAPIGTIQLKIEET